MKSATMPRASWIPKDLKLPTVVGLILVPLLLMGTVFVIHRELSRARDLREAIDHSYEKRAQLQTVFSLMQDAETGQRGFVITGQPQFLEPYENAVRALEPARTRQRQLQREDPGAGTKEVDHKAAARLDALIEAKLAFMRQIIETRRRDGAGAARDLVASGESKRIMDQIRFEVGDMARAEARSLQRRVDTSAVRTFRAETAILVAFGVLAAFLFGAFVMVLRQWHARQHLLREVEASAARNQAIFESANDALITFNRSGTIESVNRAGEAMFGFRREELARRDVGLLLALPEANATFLERLTSAGGEGRAPRELTARRKDGSEFPAEVSLGRFELAGDSFVVGSVRDISERRRVEKLKSEFVSTVSHELRTPLTSIAGSLGLLVGGAAGELPDKAARLLGIAHSNCQRLVRLINDILDIEKIESGQMTFVLAPLDLAEVARKAVEAMGGLAGERGVRFELKVDPDALEIRGDADRLAQVAANLLSNAVKFSPAGERVEVAVTRTGQGRVRLSVRDHGPGVPEHFREQIFSKFAQADSSDTRAKGGTGLGLAISREIVERLGGRLWFESVPGEGATFNAEFPSTAPAEPAGSGLRVLVCEDDADAAEVLAETLRSEGFVPVVAHDLAQAEKQLDGGVPFCAALLDLHLPDGHGLDLLRRLREREATRELPALIVSGEADGRGVQPLDVVDWLRKPVDAERLRASIQRAVSGHAGPRPLVLHVEDDPDMREVVANALAAFCDVAPAENVQAALEALRRLKPQLAILDLALGDGSGLELLPALSGLPVIIFSAESPGAGALPASVDAVLTKSRASLDELGAMVRRLAAAQSTG